LSDTPSSATRSRVVTWEDPMISAGRMRDMSGLEFLRAFLAGEMPPPPIARLMNFTLTEVDEGRAVFEGEPAEYHYNPIGVVHGGLAMTMLDSALGCAVQSALPLGAGYTTLETKVNLVRAITGTTGPLRCEGKVVHVGRATATAEGRLTGADGKLYAHGTTTCLIMRG
jgi:uncharacterized protein (TIGR00369 family)